MNKKGIKKILLFIILFSFFVCSIYAEEYDHEKEVITKAVHYSRRIDLYDDVSFSLAAGGNNSLFFYMMNDSRMPFEYTLEVQVLEEHNDIIYTFDAHEYDGDYGQRMYVYKGDKKIGGFRVVIKYNDFKRYRDFYPDEDNIILSYEIGNLPSKEDELHISEIIELMRTREDVKFFYRRIPKKIKYHGIEYDNKIIVDPNNYFYEFSETEDYYQFSVNVEDIKIDTIKRIYFSYVLLTKDDNGNYLLSELNDNKYKIIEYIQDYDDLYNNDGIVTNTINNSSCEYNGVFNKELNGNFKRTEFIKKGDSIVCSFSFSEVKQTEPKTVGQNSSRGIFGIKDVKTKIAVLALLIILCILPIVATIKYYKKYTK